ncbi:MAG: hypothetical protein RR248_02645 [Clostridia bacterium]
MNKIFEYQALDGQLKKIRKELNNSDENKAFNSWASFLQKAQDELIKLENRTRELNYLLDKQTENFEEKQKVIDDYNLSIDKCIDTQELEYLTKKLNDLSRILITIDKDIRILTAEVDEISAKYDAYKVKVPNAQEKKKFAKSKLDELVNSRRAEMDSIKAQLAEMEKEIEPSMIEEYNSLKKQAIFPPFVTLRSTNQCGGCSMELPNQQVSMLNSEGRVRCEHCRRTILKE